MFNLHNRLYSTQLFLAGLSLQTRFLLIFGASSLFLALVIWVVFNSITERTMERIGARFAEKQVLYDKAHTLQPLIRKVALVRQMADNAVIKQWAANEQNPQLHRQALAEIEILRRHFNDDSYFIALTQSGHYYSDNQHLNNTHQGKQRRYILDPAKPTDAWFYAATKIGGDYHIDVDSDTNHGATSITINAPLRNGDRVLGVIGTTQKIDDLIGHVTDAPQSGVSNVFIDRSAVIQVYRGVNHIDFSSIAKPPSQKHSIDYLLNNPEDRDWVRQSIDQFENGGSTIEKNLHIKGKHYLVNSPMATRFVQINGKRYLAGMMALPEMGWYDITLLDMSTLLPQHDFLEMWLAIGGVALALMVILLFSLRRLVLRPVAVLTAASDRIRRGDYADISPKKGSGEIGQLAAQFQAMRHAVHKTHNWMEDEIRKRTCQLSDAKEMLEVSLQQEKNSRENLSNLLSLMAHEIRSPIAVISNTAQMLNVLTQSERPNWQPRIEKILGAVLQLAVLMNKFLDENRIGMKNNELDMQMGDLNIFCADIASTLAANHCRVIRYSPWSGSAMLLADWHLIGIAIGNLIDNAIKYSPPDSDIDLRVVQGKADTLCVEVTDHGPGISPELQQRIFTEKFIRGKHGSKIRGTGLGLYLSNWIAMSHGGYAEVSSLSNSGSTFRICLSLRKHA